MKPLRTFRLEEYLGEWEFPDAAPDVAGRDVQLLDPARLGPARDLFDWEPPVGGCVCFPRYKGGDVDDFARRLVTKAGVVVLPASVYYSELADTPPDHFRVGLGRLGLEEGLKAFDRFLSEG